MLDICLFLNGGVEDNLLVKNVHYTRNERTDSVEGVGSRQRASSHCFINDAFGRSYNGCITGKKRKKVV